MPWPQLDSMPHASRLMVPERITLTNFDHEFPFTHMRRRKRERVPDFASSSARSVPFLICTYTQMRAHTSHGCSWGLATTGKCFCGREATARKRIISIFMASILRCSHGTRGLSSDSSKCIRSVFRCKTLDSFLQFEGCAL